jgi:hypothetical protein
VIEKILVQIWEKINSPGLAQMAARIVAILLILIVGTATVYRASRSHGSQYDDFYNFSKDLLYDRINIYQAYSFERTTIAKYPPFFSILFAPFVPIPFLLGAALWFVIGITLVYFSSQAIAKMGWYLFQGKGTAPPTSWWVAPIVMTLVIVMSNLATSQVNIFIFSLVIFSLSAFLKKKDYLAGLLIGVATAIKLTPGLFVLYFAYKGCWKPVLWAAIGGLACWGVLLPLVMGPEYYVEVMGSWIAMLQSYVAEGSSVDGLAGYKHTNQSMEAFFYRYFTHTPANGGFDDFYVNLLNIPMETAAWIVKALKVILLLILAWVCRSPLRERSNPMLMLEFSLIIMATLYISPISWINHYVVMILPFATAFYLVSSLEQHNQLRHQMLTALMAAVVMTYLTHPIFLAFSLAFLGSLILFFTISRILKRDIGLPL